MRKSLLSNRLGRWLAGATLVVLATPGAHAQLAGTKTIPGSYATLAAAITDLNTQGVGAGGVTFNITAGYTETAANLLITATGTSANPIIFQKSGTGANPLITAGVGTSTTLDAVIGLSGADYVTIDGIDVAESATNATATTQMEFGYALFRASVTDGSQFNIIRNCVVTLNKTNANTIGIYGAPSTTASATAITATAASGANSSNKIYSNVVTNALTGIYLAAGSSTTIANYDQNNEIGVTAGNTIGNFGGSASAYGAGGTYQNGLKITGNTINSTLNYTSATASTPVAASTVTSTLRGIYTPSGTSSSLDITNNTITLASGATTSQLSGIENSMGNTPTTNVVNITGNTLSLTYTTATSAAVYGFYNNGSPATLNISNNTLSSATLSNTGSTYLIYNNHSATAANVTGNQLGGVTRTGASGTVYGYYNNGSGAGTQTLTRNVITNISVAGSSTFYGLYNTSASAETQLWSANQITNITATATPTGTLYGIYNTYGAAGSLFFDNIITGLSGGGTVYGLNLTNSALATAAAYGNTIGALSTTGTSNSVYGLYTSVTTPTIYRNKIYGLSGTGTGVTIYGLYTAGGTTITLYNNLIGDLQAPAATGLTAVSGMYFSSGTTINAYYNTIYLAATSTGATFGTSGIYLSATPTALDLRNNIVVNKSTAAGTGGYTAALRRASGTAGTVPAALATTNNNNLYYAGTPSATNLIYVEGTTTATNAQQTLAVYKAFVAPRETNSVTEDVAFLSTTGTAATFLHINPATATQAEGAGTPIAGITTDFDNDTRNANTPDIGADEGTFVPQDLTPPSILYATLSNTASLTNRTLTVTITDASGLATGANGPRLFFRKSASAAYASVLATTTSGSTYTFTFDYSLLGGVAIGDVIQYYVAAQDAATPANSGTNPLGGTYATATATPNSYNVLAPLSGNYYVGTSTHTPAATYATLTAAAADYNSKGLSGAVNFILIDSNYSTAETFPIVFNANGDASATNTLTIKPETGVTAAIAGSVATGAVLKLNGTDYVTIDGSNNGSTSQNLTISNTSATGTGNAVLWLAAASATDGATYNTVKNTLITGNSNTGYPQFTVFLGGGGAGVTAPTTSTPAANSNNTFSNNVITKGYYGVFVFGVSATVLDQGNTFTGNQIGQSTSGTGFGLEGMRAVYQQNLTIQANEIQGAINAAAASHFGLNLSTLKNSLIDRNSIHDVQSNSTTSGYVGYGISLASTTFTTSTNASANTVSNNIIYNISAPLAATSSNPNVLGIANGGGYGDKLYFNTILLNGAQTAGTGYSAAISNGDAQYATTTSVLDMRNNIIAITANVTTAAKYFGFYTAAASVAGSTLDYNDYYLAGTGSATFAVGNLNGTSLASSTTLAAWQTATSQEANSKSVDPQFAQTTAVPFNLTPSNVALNNVGTPISGITTDYTGATRGTTPDIGAIEFTPQPTDLTPVALVAPATTSTCYGTAEAVSVSIRNAGTAALNFATNAATITVVVTLPGGTTQTLTTTVNTGTLASNATQTVVLPTTLNMSTVGTYSFAITATVVGDGNTANDVLAPAPTRTVLAPVAGTLSPAATAICVSGTATLTLTGAANGSIQFQSSPDNVTFTDIAGATTATFTTPVLTTTTYYRAQVRCNTGTATSNVSTITVNNPLVATTNTPVSVCAGSSATLTATASAGSSVRFFDVATGGTALTSATVGTYTTPALTTNTTYYAEAYSGGQENVGKTLTNGADGTNTAGGLYFTTTGPTTISNVTVYRTASAAAGTATIYLLPGNPASVTTAILATALTSATVTVPANTTTAVSPTVLTLNFAVPAAGTYTLYLGAASPSLVRDYSSAALPATAFPYTSASGTVRITDGTLAGYYYFFYNWQLSSECVNATRTPIQVTVNPTPARPTLTPTYNGTTTTLTSSSATGNQFYFNGAAIAGATGQTYVVNGSATTYGSYTVVVTNSFGCSSAASVATVVTTTRAGIAGASLLVYPNPTPTGQVTLELSGFRSATQLAVIDALGRVVRSETLPATAGVVTHSLDLSRVASGVYMLRLTNADGVETRRLVRE